MKTCCPDCQTTFRVTSAQLKARAGRVRCGHCRRVFNALDSLLDDAAPRLPAETPPTAEAAHPRTGSPVNLSTPPAAAARAVALPLRRAEVLAAADEAPAGEMIAGKAGKADHGDQPPREERAASASRDGDESEPTESAPVFAPIFARLQVHDANHHRIADTSVPAPQTPPPARERALQTAGLGAPEPASLAPENRESAGRERWLEKAIGEPVPAVAGKTPKAPFVTVIVLLVVVLIGQIVFHLRGVIALTTPGARPALAALSAAVGSEIPLPRHVDLVSIEASDLQTEPGRNKRLALQATLRNRASYPQAFPAIELTLTDTADKAIVRRVFLPAEYLTPAQSEAESFAANADLEVRLWLDASQVNAAGYRLYVFYP